MTESSRISRGVIQEITELKSSCYDCLVLPGGFGVAKNLSNFAIENEKFTVDKEVERVIKDFYSEKKHIVACCIAPILLGKVLGKSNNGPGVQLTLGSEGVKIKINYFRKIGLTQEPLDLLDNLAIMLKYVTLTKYP